MTVSIISMMKNNVISKLLVIIGLAANIAAYAQSTRFTGQGFPTDGNRASLVLSHTSGFQATLPLRPDGSFDTTLHVPQDGIYQLRPVGDLFLERGASLHVTAESDGTFSFSGMGAKANNRYRSIRQLAADFLPMHKGELRFAAYALDVPVFEAKLQQYVQAAGSALHQERNELLARALAKESRYYAMRLLGDFRLHYGVDSAKQQAFYAMMEKADRTDTTLAHKISDAYKKTRYREFTAAERTHIDSLLYDALDIDDEEAFAYAPSYREVLSGWISNRIYRERRLASNPGNDMQSAQLGVVNDHFTNPTIAEYYRYVYSLNLIKMTKDDRKAEEAFSTFAANAKNETFIEQLKTVFENRKVTEKGRPAPDFAFENIDGKIVQLRDLRGKYVYIDVWATWCGPCKMEIPHLAKLEKDLHGKNITFVSLSVDRPADKGKWQKFVTENGLGGLQLITDNAFETAFIQQFNINSIPRFILIDPEGIILSANADRPSEPALREQLKGLLEKSE